MVALAPLAVDERPDSQTCQHLAPLVRELAAAGVAVGPGRRCPHDAEWGMWFYVDAVLTPRRLKRRLGLDPCVIDEAYEGVLAGSDITFYCTECKQAIVGLHPRHAAPGIQRIG